MLSCKTRVSLRELLLVTVFIGSVCFVTLTPAMYLAFHALRWAKALRVVELAFPPALLLAIAAGLLAHQRAQARRDAAWRHETYRPDD
jgi:hypothetical protein